MGRKDSPTITARFGGGSMSSLADIAEIEQTAHQKRQKKITKQGNKRERKGKGQK